MAAVRAELLGLKTGLLRQRARAAGVDMDRFDEAVDEDDKPAMVELVVVAEEVAAVEAEAAALRAELAGAKTGVLRKRARVEGADMNKVEEAIDEDNKAAIIELIVAAAAAAATVGGGGGGSAAGRPPEGLPPPSAPQPEPSRISSGVSTAASNKLYIAARNAVIRADFEMDSANVGTLKKGVVIEVLSEKLNEKGQARVQFAGGWTSKATATGAVVLQEAAAGAQVTFDLGATGLRLETEGGNPADEGDLVRTLTRSNGTSAAESAARIPSVAPVTVSDMTIARFDF
jgi:hypothetical protein